MSRTVVHPLELKSAARAERLRLAAIESLPRGFVHLPDFLLGGQKARLLCAIWLAVEYLWRGKTLLEIRNSRARVESRKPKSHQYLQRQVMYGLKFLTMEGYIVREEQPIPSVQAEAPREDFPGMPER